MKKNPGRKERRMLERRNRREEGRKRARVHNALQQSGKLATLSGGM